MRTLLLLLVIVTISPAEAEWRLGNYKELARLPNGGVAWEREAVSESGTVRLTGFSFPAKSYVFHVVDNPPPSRNRLAAVLPSAGAVAGINASYFHPDFTPLGLVISGGKEIHGYEKAKLLSGIVAVRNGRFELVRASNFKPGAAVTEAIQAGPWLVENSRAITGLNDERRARRSVVATDGRGTWSIIALSPTTLAQSASLLASHAIFSPAPLKDALNLDGGSSTALWVAGEPAPIAIPEFGGVRNYLAIKPRMP